MKGSPLSRLIGEEVGFPRGFLVLSERSDEFSPLLSMEEESQRIKEVLDRIPSVGEALGRINLGELLSVQTQSFAILQLWELALEGQKARVVRSMIQSEGKVGEWKARAKSEAHPLVGVLAQEVVLWRALSSISTSALSLRSK